MPDIIDAFSVTGKSIVNAELFVRGVEQIMQGVVDILNASGVGAKPEAGAKLEPAAGNGST
jgi:hypothetical protein